MKEAQPSVLAMSWGEGDPRRDAITLVFLDAKGVMREQTNLDNLADVELREEFADLIRRRKPDVIGVGGFSIATTKLSSQVKEAINGLQQVDDWSAETQHTCNPPVIYVRDDVARLFQHSERAKEEFSAYSQITKYCVGLARYVQSPLNEYAALGPDITTLMFKEVEQQLVRLFV
jgi:transcription elongation factor SPT6